MRSAIVTFNRALNFGAILQAYALQESVSLYSEKCFVIDYKCEEMEKSYSISSALNIKSLIGFIKSVVTFFPRLFLLEKKRKKYNKFIDLYLNVYKLNNNNINAISDNFDIFITGSDQVWNYNITGNDDTYFLDFLSNASKKYSYAASFGQEKYFEKYKNKILENITGFNMVSLREPIGTEQLKAQGYNVRTDIDPTLLLNVDKWTEIIENDGGNEKYVLVYHVAEPNNLLSQASEFAKKNNLKICYITESLLAKLRYPDFIIKRSCGPIDFIRLVKNAKYVFTTSFHGTAFSILFHKNFYAEINNKDGYNYRVANILDLLGLMKCADYNNIANGSLLKEDEWLEADKRLDSLRKNSLDYLRSIIGEQNYDKTNTEKI